MTSLPTISGTAPSMTNMLGVTRASNALSDCTVSAPWELGILKVRATKAIDVSAVRSFSLHHGTRLVGSIDDARADIETTGGARVNSRASRFDNKAERRPASGYRRLAGRASGSSRRPLRRRREFPAAVQHSEG